MFVSLLLPSFYLAVINFHPEMLPGDLIITIAASRDIIPFPALIEALIMEISFEVLREAGIRIPTPIGQTVSILGALIIGTAAVQAGIVSAPMVIIVSLTGIASFIIPHFDLATSLRLLRFPLLFLSGMLGILGLMFGLIIMAFHLCSLRSFGTPYLKPLAPLSFSDWKDTVIRAPFWAVKTRANLYGTQNYVRNKNQMRPLMPEESD
ncbi:MAG: spore germination protein [Bacillus sp. (in: Bacteria)]|nr:spore germination protein [Bacillus sp. (in: firmicutes)]